MKVERYIFPLLFGIVLLQAGNRRVWRLPDAGGDLKLAAAALWPIKVQEVDLTRYQHFRASCPWGLPLILANIAQISIGVVDTVMTGWYSVEALAALVLGSSFFFVVFSLHFVMISAKYPLSRAQLFIVTWKKIYQNDLKAPYHCCCIYICSKIYDRVFKECPIKIYLIHTNK